MLVKHLAIVLFVCSVLSASAGVRAAGPALEDSVVWYATPGTRGYVQPALDRWQQLHPGTPINLVEGNGPDILERVNAEARAGHPVADLITFGDLTMWELAANNGLGTYTPSEMPNLRYVVPRI